MVRVGDTVTLANATLPVRRVGYRLHRDEVSVRDDEELQAFLDTVPGHWHIKVKQAIKKALQEQFVYSRAFGGNERMVIREDDQDAMLPAGEYIVTEKKVKYTGRYHPPSNGYDYYSGGHWCDDGYLSNRKPVVLLHIMRDNIFFGDKSGWITVDDLASSAEVFGK